MWLMATMLDRADDPLGRKKVAFFSPLFHFLLPGKQMLGQVAWDHAEGASPMGAEGPWVPDTTQPSFSLAYVQTVV